MNTHCVSDYTLTGQHRVFFNKAKWFFAFGNLKILFVFVPSSGIAGSYGSTLFKLLQSVSWRGICAPMFTVALVTVAKIWKESKSPVMDG